ncbi:hypothetical protein Cgig2_023321 [Carnegiea gigantea]|uniref:Protein FAR1-RELATED SEQUENCE n=1 Tax=Carnegiea gigantea TaxID=171969 RepID=A0A9Q1QCN6_9CARY|nr:hypothetical protein Cgig2_023321 [Carnegiea gigantea]
MMMKYQCSSNIWLCNLYSLREKWCPAFSKSYFSGGVLSSQWSETTNRSLKRRLHATADLCDFYNIFCDVVSEWRSKENGEDHRCSKGIAEMVFPSVNILKHALSVYTIEAFLRFEKEFIDAASHNYKEVDGSTSNRSFEVWGFRVTSEFPRDESYELHHIVTFNEEEGIIYCTYQMFTEVGMLCSHSLRVLHACYVNQVPDKYINKRWCKGIKDGQNLDVGISNGKEPMVCSSVWKMQMIRKMNSLITASQLNFNARAHCEKYFTELKKLIKFDVGSIHCEQDGQEKNLDLPQNVLNPPCSRQKGVRNKRFKIIVEKKCDQVKRKKSKKMAMNDVDCSTSTPQVFFIWFDASSSGPSSSCPSYTEMMRQGAFPLLSSQPTYYFGPSNGSSVVMPMMIPSVSHQLRTNIFLANASHDDKH